VSSAPAWVAITGGASGSGSGTVRYSVAANAGTQQRQSMIVAGGKSFTITQAGVPCTYTLTPKSASFDNRPGNGSFSLTTTGASCTWTVTSASTWIFVVSALSGTGSTTVNYLVYPNGTGASRTATIGIGGQTYTVSQAK
jgi:hypothetical protein